MDIREETLKVYTKRKMVAEVVSGDSSSSSSSISVRKGFSHFTAVCFTINYLIGTGFLTLPWAFQQGGTLLSTITLLFVVFICNICKNYVLETMARAEAMIGFTGDGLDEVGNEEGVSLTRAEIKRADSECYGSTQDSTEAEVSVESPQDSPPNTIMEPFSISLRKDMTYEVKERKFEYVELCRIFLGAKGEKAYIAAVTISIFAQLWGYTSVFSSAMATAAPISKDFGRDYTMYTLIFGSIVVPLSCLDLKEQVQFQMFLTFCRFVVIGLMVMTAFTAGVDGTTSTTHEKVYFIGTDGPEGASLVDFSGFYEMFSVLVYAAMFHNAIPVLSEPVADKRTLNIIFRDGFVVCGAAFWVIGYVIAWYFGDHIEQSANLNWEYFVGGTGRQSPDGKWVDVAIWAKALSIFVLCFPAVNIVSAYPLNAVVLGNNLLTKLCGPNETSRHKKTFFRLVSSFPPVFGALFVRDLGIITSYAGILAIITVLCFPALMHLSSKQEARKRGYLNATCYESVGSSDVAAYSIVTLSVVASIYVLVNLLLGS